MWPLTVWFSGELYSENVYSFYCDNNIIAILNVTDLF